MNFEENLPEFVSEIK